MGNLFSNEDEERRRNLEELQRQQRREENYRKQRELEEIYNRQRQEAIESRKRELLREQIRLEQQNRLEGLIIGFQRFSLNTQDTNRIKNITPNPIIKDLLQNTCDSLNWDIKNSAYILTQLEEYSSEFVRVKRLFTQTNKQCFKVTHIEKIFNPYLLLQHTMKKIQYQEKYRHVNKKELFHGTEMRNIEGICKYNFDWRKVTKYKFGKGISFTPISNYATHYCDKTFDKVMILVNVLVSRDCLGTSGSDLPPFGYDTTTNENKHVYVKYEDCTFYPQYIIHFQGFDMTKQVQKKRR